MVRESNSQCKSWGEVFIGDFHLMAPVFSVCLPVSKAIISVKVLRFFTLGYSHRIAVAHYSVIRIMRGGVLQFSDNYKSYDGRGVFAIAGAASLCSPPPLSAWPPNSHNFTGHR